MYVNVKGSKSLKIKERINFYIVHHPCSSNRRSASQVLRQTAFQRQIIALEFLEGIRNLMLAPQK